MMSTHDIGRRIAEFTPTILKFTTPQNSFSLKHVAVALLGVMLWAVHIPIASAITQNEIQKILAEDAASYDQFGLAVSLDGDTALIGSVWYDSEYCCNTSGSAYVFVRSAAGWIQQAKLTASDADDTSQFGGAVSIDGDTALIGDVRVDYAGNGLGSAYVFVRSAAGWIQQAKLTASDTDEVLDTFGTSVSIDGDTALIGSIKYDENGQFDSSSAYVFVRSGASWTQQAKLTASDAAEGDNFGGSVSIDGDTALIGARGDDEGGDNSGSAYVFVRSGMSWTQEAKLTASDAAENDRFGWSVSIDGETALIGAFRVPGDGSGSAYAFVRNGSIWTQQAKLTASDTPEGDAFGVSVSLNGDSALIAASYDDDGGARSGSAYVFFRNETLWTQQAKLTASDAAEGDNFGGSVSIDGDTALIGARGDGDAGPYSGSAYVFDLTPDTDEDGVSDSTDNCPVDFNPLQEDTDEDLLGDVCDTDDDNDTILDDVDNCPLVPNTNQADVDGDGIGDVCEDNGGNDSDSDGVTDADDQCPLTKPYATTEGTGCSIAQLCPADGHWRNHGKYVRCVVRETRQFLRSGLITKKERRAIVREAARSDIGKMKKRK